MEKILKILRARLGDDDAARTEFLKYKLSHLNVLDMTASELISAAGKEGWDEMLRDLTLEEFSGLLGQSPNAIWSYFDDDKTSHPSEIKARSTAKRKKSRKKASSINSGNTRQKKTDISNKKDHVAADRQEMPLQMNLPMEIDTPAPLKPKEPSLDDHIIACLREHPWCKYAEIEEKSKISQDELKKRLKRLQEIGWIKVVENSGNPRYALN